MADSLTRRRVKVYMLNPERQWDDRGTGHVSSAYVEHLQGMTLLVRSETDGTLLLESKILPNTAYQKQQDTLIVWSEADNFDLALSFQEKAGCDEIWEKICQVQGKDPSVEVTQDVIDESEDERFDDIPDSTLPVELPSCELSKLEDILTTISNCLPSPVRREKLATAIEQEDYINKLLDLFHMCEDLDNMDGLHHLYDIFKSIFLLNQNSLLEILFQDSVIFDVLGVLEYDPSSSKPAHHREYLRQSSHFKEVIPITNQELLHKIHQTYRMQYIQDVILPTPSVFEENMLSSLSSYIFFNKNEIVNMLQNDEVFLTVLFAQLTDDETDDAKRRDLMLFLKEFCTFSQTLQANDREKFFNVLSNLGILSALEIILGLEDEQIKSAAIDIFSFVVEFNPSMVRDFITQEGHNQDDDDLLMNLVIEQMINDSDPELGGAVQLMGILRLLVDPENMLAAKSKNEFLGFFYKHSMHVLTAPLMANTTGDKPSKDDFQTAQLLGLILELLAFCVEHHTYHMKNYVLSKDLLRRVLVLMKSRHAFLALCSLRFMRRIISMKDDFYNRYITRGNLFTPVVEAFKDNGGRYNLLNSAVIELFEFIKSEDMKILYTHVVENHYSSFETVDYVQTFKALKVRHDQQQDRLKDAKSGLDNSVPSILRNNRFRRDARTLEEEEEMWFDQDDEFDDGDALVTAPDQLKMKIDSDFDHINKLLENKRTKELELTDSSSPPKLINKNMSPININLKSVSPTATPISSPADSPTNTPPKNGSPQDKGDQEDTLVNDSTHKPPRIGLVDYPDDDDEADEPDDSADQPAAKRARLIT